MVKSTSQPVVIIPNFNGGSPLLEAVSSLLDQTLQPHIVVVDNASTDGSIDTLLERFPHIKVIRNASNKGFSGGVNDGITYAFSIRAEYVAAFNDDATADRLWLEKLKKTIDSDTNIAAVDCTVLTSDGSSVDSTGIGYTTWGLPYPMSRGISASTVDRSKLSPAFSTSGAACLYRVKALQEVGLLDEDFFAYYEDVDLGFRLQLAGWKIAYVPDAIVYHKIGMTSSRIKGFTTYQTMKNLPLLAIKNVPRRYMATVMIRLTLARSFFLLRAISRGQGLAAIKGDAVATTLILKKLRERKQIQATKKVSDEYIWSIMTHDLPPNAAALRTLRAKWWRLIGKRV